MLNDLLLMTDSSYMTVAKHFGVSYNELLVLYVVDEGYAATQREICDTLHLPKFTVHNVMYGLISKGLLDMTEGEDVKGNHVILTNKGLEMYLKLLQSINKVKLGGTHVCLDVPVHNVENIDDCRKETESA